MKGRVYDGWVVGIVDGDTMDVSIDLGFCVSVVVRVRLRLVYAPEVTSSEGLMCAEKLRELCPVSSKVDVRTYKTERYGRWVADVWKGGTFVNEEMRKFIPGGGPGLT